MPTHGLTFLIRTNLEWLHQAAGLLERLSDEQYLARPDVLGDQRASGHVRHILEFYEGFLGGLTTGQVDYEARRRDPLIESSRSAALARVRELAARLSALEGADFPVWVRIEGADEFVQSSVGRELLTLSSHTIHHFALIGFVLRLIGVAMPPDFGVAPSTLEYRRTKEAA